MNKPNSKNRPSLAPSVALACMVLLAAEASASGLFVGGSVGTAFVDENLDGSQFNADSNAFQVFGGYEFTDNFGVEVSYLDLGTFKDTFDVAGELVKVTANADGFTLAAFGRLPLSERFSVHAKAGVFFWDGQSSTAGITENDPGDQNPFIGAGVSYDLSDNARLSLGADYYDMDDAQPLVASVGIAFRF